MVARLPHTPKTKKTLNNDHHHSAEETQQNYSEPKEIPSIRSPGQAGLIKAKPTDEDENLAPETAETRDDGFRMHLAVWHLAKFEQEKERTYSESNQADPPLDLHNIK